jgi:hypothetical protein
MASPSGIPQLGDLAHGSHVGQLYRDSQDLLEMLVPYFASGLVAYERCIWVTSPPLGAAQARAALARRIPDLADREATGQIEIILAHARWDSGRQERAPSPWRRSIRDRAGPPARGDPRVSAVAGRHPAVARR